jgi:hypothetical protein
MSKETKNQQSSGTAICLDPKFKLALNVNKISIEETNSLNLEIRKQSAEINKIEYKTEIDTKEILVDGFII